MADSQIALTNQIVLVQFKENKNQKTKTPLKLHKCGKKKGNEKVWP